jgi:hypothetical protein
VNKTLRGQFNALREADGHINPRSVWVAKARTELLASIAQAEQVSTAKTPERSLSSVFSSIVPTNMFSHARPVFASLLVFLLATSGWMTSASASESLPGDALWKVKLAGEKTQVVLANMTGNDTKHVELQLKFAARRAEEIKTITDTDTFDKAEKVKRTEEGLVKLQENISSVGEAVNNASASDEQKQDISKKAKAVNDTTNQISETLKEVANIVQDDSTQNDSFTKSVVAIKQTVDDVGLDVVRVAVEGATSDAERAVATQLVEEKIVSVLSEADGTLDKSEEVKTLIGQVNTQTEVSHALGALQIAPPSTTASTTAPALTTSTTDVTTSSVSATTPGAVAPTTPPTAKDVITSILGQVDRTSQVVQESIVTIKALIDAGDVTGALEKAKQLKKLTNDSAQKTNEIQKVVERVVSDQKTIIPTTPGPSPATSTADRSIVPTTTEQAQTAQ